MTNNNESLNDNNDAIVNESENNSEIVDSLVDKENIPEKINYLNPEILNVKKYTYEQLMEQTDDEKLISDDAELYSNDDFSNISEKQLVKITDLLGRKVSNYKSRNIPLIYIYDDGTVEKKIIIE